IVGRLPSPAKAVRKIAIRYEPVSRQVATIETRLREGRATLLHDNLELRKLYEGVEQQRPEITRSAYLGELIMDGLESAVDDEKDADKSRRLEMALANVATRVQDLHTINEVCMQYLVSIEMSRQNNTSLVHAIDRTLALGSNVVMIGLAIHVALSRQARVMEANQRTREFLGNLVVSNAELIKRHTEEIGDIYKSPVIAIEKVTQAHAALVDAIETARRVRAEGVNMARQNIQRLNALSSQVNGEMLALAGADQFHDSDTFRSTGR
ncbi:MAG: toxic anion resistance protein, partial [Chloroflexi bacterium]|nr:toxic anion resistance protein [Chloroflexota bacterium]